MAVKISYHGLWGAKKEDYVGVLACNAHDTEEENMEDSEYGFSMFHVYVHRNKERTYNRVVHQDNEYDEDMVDLPMNWDIS